MKILITGGCGFVGCNLALYYKDLPWVTGITVFDNLHRRGSELNMERLINAGIKFVHGDVRIKEDLMALEPHDILIEASAEPSVHAGNNGDPSFVIGSNLIGAINCLEYARKYNSIFVFLSTSRVYSIKGIKEKVAKCVVFKHPFISMAGEPSSTYTVNERFPTNGFRSIYGTTKLAAELLVEEYHNTYGLRTVINRCGVLAGPGQFGKTDQGVVALWVAAHEYGFPLCYKGFGGKGQQVRDILHIGDLADLIQNQLNAFERVNGEIFNVGGGNGNAISLRELTGICEEVTGAVMAQIAEDPATSPVDIPWYVTDNTKIQSVFPEWSPKRSIKDIVSNIHDWLKDNDSVLRPIFLGSSR